MNYRLFQGVLIIGAVLLAGCATSVIGTADISDYYQVRTVSGSLLYRQHAQIFVKSERGNYEYLASIRDPGWAEKFPFGFSGLRAKNVAISSDGRSVVYEHNAVLAGKKSQKESGLYRHEYGIGEKLLLKNDEFSIPATSYPKPLPPDMLVISRWDPGNIARSTEAIATNGDIAPALLLGGTSLHQAAFDGDIEAIARTVREQRESLNALTYWEMTALEVAVLSRKEAAAGKLLMLGASYRDTEDEKSLIFLASAYRSPLVVDELLKRKVPFQFTITDGITPFHALLRFYSPDMLFLPSEFRVTDLDSFVSTLDVYLKHGTDINLRDGKGRTLLHLPWPNAHPTNPNALVVAHLIDKGIDAELTDKEGNTALHQAVAIEIDERNKELWEQRKLPVIRMIAEKMKTVDVKNDQGVSPLQRAVQSNYIRTAEYLIAHGADASVEFIHRALGPKIPGQSIQDRIEFIKKR